MILSPLKSIPAGIHLSFKLTSGLVMSEITGVKDCLLNQVGSNKEKLLLLLLGAKMSVINGYSYFPVFLKGTMFGSDNPLESRILQMFENRNI